MSLTTLLPLVIMLILANLNKTAVAEFLVMPGTAH
jgi:hypothetical protein